MKEKRLRRVTARHRALIRLDFDHNGAWLSCESLDLSLGGLCMSATTALPVAKEIALRLHLPQHGVIEAVGRVCWFNEKDGELGIEFLRMGPDELLVLARWLKDQR